jgi:hypothetical protein
MEAMYLFYSPEQYKQYFILIFLKKKNQEKRLAFLNNELEILFLFSEIFYLFFKVFFFFFFIC